jgi:cyclopropane fatty-acyl-phospholipid synthase-like methyltransferase
MLSSTNYQSTLKEGLQLMTTLSKWIYELSYRFTQPNWDQNSVPPEVAALPENGGPGQRALDLGCGTGTCAIYLAQRGYDVVGVDFSSKAISLARKKAHQAGVSVDLRLGDVTRLDALRDPFDVALDIGCFHGLSNAERKQYEKTLARLTHPGSLFLLWAITEQSHVGIGINSEEISQCFDPHFVVERVADSSDHGRASAWYWIRRL